jgi:hypothetical protein
MAEQLSREQARTQAWEMMLAKAREAQQADPKAVAAAKTLLVDPAWKEAIEEGVTASTVLETVEKATFEPPVQAEQEHAATEVAEDGLPTEYTRVPWDVIYPGYIDGQLAFGVPFDEARTEKEGTLVIEDIKWGSAASG